MAFRWRRDYVAAPLLSRSPEIVVVNVSAEPERGEEGTAHEARCGSAASPSLLFSATAGEAGGKWPISNGVGVDPRWRGDGRELYYRTRDGGVMAVDIVTNPAFRAGKPIAGAALANRRYHQFRRTTL